MNILIDGMGGDYAPQEIVKGAISAARKIEDTITIIGAQELIGTELEKRGWDGDNIAVVNATEVVTNNEAPAMAVRKKKDATVNVGMRMIKAGDGDVFISGGSTGALLAAGLLGLGRIKGIKRPAIAAFFPQIGKNETTLLLDCGANVDCKSEYLYQFGIMGSIYVENVKGIEHPDVRLLNVGTEAEKGDDLHKEAHELLANSSINFKGNVEGREIASGVCDVVVTDGFSGNVFLKSSEGLALSIMGRLKGVLLGGTISRIAALMLSKQLKEMKKEFDYSEEGGAPILGLKGPVLKIHGSSKAYAVYNAILKARDYVASDVTGQIEKALADNDELSEYKTEVTDGNAEAQKYQVSDT